MSPILYKFHQRSLCLCNVWKRALTDHSRKEGLAMDFLSSSLKSLSCSNYMHLLESLNRYQGIRLGLVSSEKLAELMGSPHLQYKIVHVAGTNGKGSTVAKIASCLQLKGYKVGTFTSPHLFSFRERFQINGELISEEDIVKQCREVLQVARDKNLDISFFMACTQIAFSYFAYKKVDWAVIETGLGGRLDSTNIIESPKATVITSIGYDHMEILGNSLQFIAMEKAGIFKRNCPVVLGPSVIAYSEVWQRARELNCEVFTVKPDPRGMTYDEENSKISEIALTKALKIDFSPQLLAKGLNAIPPCRLQKFSSIETERAFEASLELLKDKAISSHIVHIRTLSVCPIIVDVAHNLPGLERLCQDIGHSFFGRKVRFCISLSSNKNCSILNAVVSHFYFPKNNRLAGMHYLPSSHRRSKSAEDFCSQLKTDPHVVPELLKYGLDGLQQNKIWIQNGPFGKDTPVDATCDNAGVANLPESLPKIIASALLKATIEDSVLVICGSFFVMQQVLQALNFPLGIVDPIESNETGAIIN